MKNINITKIVDPTSLQPFTGNSLKFLQDASSEARAGMIKAFITQNLGSYSLTVPYVISGCVYSGTTPNFAVTAGEIFYGGEYYELTAVSGYTNIPQFKLDKTNDPTADPLVFSDNQTWSVHDIFKFIGEDTATAKVFDATDLVNAYGTGKITSQVTSANQNTSSTSFTDLTGSTYTTPNDGITRTWLIQGKTNVSFYGSAGDGGKLQILVDGVSKDISQSYLDVLAVNVDLHIETCSVMALVSVAPNKIIKLQILSVGGGGVDFNENKFIVIQI